MRAILQRLETGDQGTFGSIQVGNLRLFTGELPWRKNEPNVSCIPEGEYACVLSYSPHFGRSLYLLTGVFARQGVRIHAANLMGDRGMGFKSQLNGCVAVGERVGWIDGQKCILLSQPALSEFMRVTDSKPFTLEVRDA